MNKFLIMGEIIQLPYEVMRLRLLELELKHPFQVEAEVWKAKSDKPYDYWITFIVKRIGDKAYIISEEGESKGVANEIC
jgi:hypothetical protein